MKAEFERTPDWLRWLIPFLLWRKSAETKSIFLTFDDGPTPDVTDKILAFLDRYNAKATFFFLGEMVEKYPELAREVAARGHTIGNHGYAHLSGWKTGLREYLKDVRRGREAIEKVLSITPKYFRPPYGQLGPLQGYCLWWVYRIAMWDVVAQDYRTDHSAARVQEIVIKHTTAGSIVLLHDSELAAGHVLEVLPNVLEHFQKQGLSFRGL